MNWAKPLGITAILLVFFGAVAGCNWGDAVRADVPKGIQASEGLPPSMPLNDSVDAYEDWLSQTTRDGRRWQAEIERASNIVAFLNTFTLKAVGEIGPAVAGVPVLSALVPALTGLAGLMLKRPGDVAKRDAEQAAREAKIAENNAWDEAFEAGKRAALEGIREVKS